MLRQLNACFSRSVSESICFPFENDLFMSRVSWQKVNQSLEQSAIQIIINNQERQLNLIDDVINSISI